MTTSHHATEGIADIVGIGFGPSNLAVAITWEEMTASNPRSPGASVFFERQPRFGWHRGMLIDGAMMQVSFLKDLVTMRNPQSRYSFIAYLHARNRLPDFINLQTTFPSRVEFHDYLEWAAERFAAQVHYDTEVTDIRPVVHEGVVTHLDVVGHTAGRPGKPVVQQAANVVFGIGSTPVLPDGVAPSERIWHSASLMERIDELTAADPRRVVVVGAGQSAAEVAEYLHRRCPAAEVCIVFERYGYSIADDNPFANRIFDPEAVGLLHGAPEKIRQRLLNYHANTNYSVVDLDLCQSLFRTYYEERLLDNPSRLRIMNASSIRSVAKTADRVRIEVEFLLTGARQTLDADAVVYATGYRPSDPLPLLKRIVAECKREGTDRLVLDRDYRVVTSEMVTCGIYLHGTAAEASHGISAGLLSTTAVRSGEIVSSILRHTRPGDTGVRPIHLSES